MSRIGTWWTPAIASIGVHGAPTTLHLADLWIKNITITTGPVSGSTSTTR